MFWERSTHPYIRRGVCFLLLKNRGGMAERTKLLKPKIKPSHHVIRNQSGDLCIGEIPGSAFVVKNPPNWFVDFVSLLDGTRTTARLIKDLNEKNHQVNLEMIENTLERMSLLKLLEDASEESTILSAEERELYNRQILYFSLIESKNHPGFYYQEQLKKQRVVILGLGGWGTWTCLQLALSGFGNIRLVDGDVVELSNLNRQVLFKHDDIGMPKVVAATQNLKKINPNVNVEAIHEFVTRDEKQIRKLICESSLVVLAWANLGYFLKNTTEEVIHRSAYELSLPLIEMGGDPLAISVGPIFTNDGISPCFLCIQSEIRAKWYSNDSLIQSFQKARFQRKLVNGNRCVNAWQNSPPLSVMAGIVADQVIKLVTRCELPFLIGKRFHISMQNLEAKIESFSQKECCPWCSGKQK